jgi:hypothetical protein
VPIEAGAETNEPRVSSLTSASTLYGRHRGSGPGRKVALAQPLDRLVAEGRLEEISGVGKAVADIITKLHRTGTHPSLASMRRDIPEGVLEMLSVPGLRADKVLKLYKELGITSLAGFEAAARADRLKAERSLRQAHPELTRISGPATSGAAASWSPTCRWWPKRLSWKAARRR